MKDPISQIFQPEISHRETTMDRRSSSDNNPSSTLDKKPSLPEPADDYKCEYPSEGTGSGLFFAIFRGGLLAPSRTTSDSILFLLTAPTAKERDDLTRQWRDHKLQELNFIGVVGALLAGCLTSTGSWPSILPNGTNSPWTVHACWYTGIVFALFAVLTAAQQSIRLHRLSAHRDGLMNIRHFMGSRVRNAEGEIEIRPRRFQVFGWQASIMFLTLSVLAMILGMCLTVWCGTVFGPLKLKDRSGWWDDNAKVSSAFDRPTDVEECESLLMISQLAVTWSIVTVATMITFMLAQISLAMRKDDA